MISLLSVFIDISRLVFLFPLSIYIAFLIYGSSVMSFNFYINSISKKETENKVIAITFDDGPIHENTPKILDTLAKYGIQCCFFVIGDRVKNNPDILQRIDSENHIIGNHSYSHSNIFGLFSSKRMIKELQDTETEIYRIIGKKVKLFRPPFGVTNPTIKKAISNFDYNIIGWNIRSFDTLKKNKTIMLQKINKQIRPGSIVLFHDTTDGLDDFLSEFIEDLIKNEYTIIRLDKLLRVKAYA